MSETKPDGTISIKDLNDLVAGNSISICERERQYEQVDTDDEEEEFDENFEKVCEKYKNADFVHKSFDELRADMQDIGLGMYKKVTLEGFGEPIPAEDAKVTLVYSVFFEKASIPVDSTLFRGKDFSFITGGKFGMLPGIDHCVMTMKVQEQAQFIIPYQHLYGEFGIPPRVPPKQDGLLIARVINVEPACGMGQVAEEEELKTYESVKKRAVELKEKAKNATQMHKYQIATKTYKEAIRILERVDTFEEQDDKERNVLVAGLLINLGLVYNTMQRPKNACASFNEVQRFFHLIPHNLKAKLLFQRARSLRSLCDYDRAIKCLHDAQKYSTDPVITKELEIVKKEKTKGDGAMAEMMKKALNLQDSVTKKTKVTMVNKDFEKNFRDTVEKFRNDENITKQMVAEDVTEQQRAIIDNVLAEEENQKHGIQLHLMPIQNSMRFCLFKQTEK